MVSVDMARRLKGAGLRWEPKLGDWAVWQKDIGLVDIELSNGIVRINHGSGYTYETVEKCLWFPTLSDLLGWLEGRVNRLTGGNGYWWNAYQDANNKWRYSLTLSEGPQFHAETPEDAAAKAVLWVLENEKRRNGHGE